MVKSENKVDCLGIQGSKKRSLTQRRVIENVQCQHCARNSELATVVTEAQEGGSKGEDQTHESPFQALGPFLRLLQVLGIFNFAIYENFSQFECKPRRILYHIFLNLIFLAIPISLNVIWVHYCELHEVTELMRNIFSKTDVVAFASLLILLQVASLGLSFNNINLCHHLNDIVNNFKHLLELEVNDTKIVGRGIILIPGIKKSYLVLIALLLVTSSISVGWTFPSIIDPLNQINTIMRIGLALSESWAFIFLHLPQLLTELLFLRLLTVLAYYYEHLITHMDCCHIHKKPRETGNVPSCCLGHSESLMQLFVSVENTFSNALVVQYTLIMGSLIFGIFLCISFFVTVSNYNYMTKNWSTCVFSMGFFLYSLVPAVRLLVTANFTNQVVHKMKEIRNRLYDLEMNYSDPDFLKKVRRTIQRYQGVEGISACNFFTVNHHLVTSIAGYLTTYIIVLIQFKMTDLSLGSRN